MTWRTQGVTEQGTGSPREVRTDHHAASIERNNLTRPFAPDRQGEDDGIGHRPERERGGEPSRGTEPIRPPIKHP